MQVAQAGAGEQVGRVLGSLGTQEQALGSWKLTRLEPITGRQVGGAGPRKPGSRSLVFRR